MITGAEFPARATVGLTPGRIEEKVRSLACMVVKRRRMACQFCIAYATSISRLGLSTTARPWPGVIKIAQAATFIIIRRVRAFDISRSFPF